MYWIVNKKRLPVVTRALVSSEPCYDDMEYSVMARIFGINGTESMVLPVQVGMEHPEHGTFITVSLRRKSAPYYVRV